MNRACDTCEWRRNDAGEVPADGEAEQCARTNPWRDLPMQRWCGEWRLSTRFGGGVDRRKPVRANG